MSPPRAPAPGEPAALERRLQDLAAQLRDALRSPRAAGAARYRAVALIAKNLARVAVAAAHAHQTLNTNRRT